MKRKKLAAWLLLLSLLTVSAAAEEPEEYGAADECIPEEYIVRTDERTELPAEGIEELAEGIYLVQTKELAETVAGENGSVEPNGTAELQGNTYSVNSEVYRMVSAECFFDAGITGAGIRIAVIDSGIDRDCAGVDMSRIEAGYDYVNDCECLQDTQNHGTTVAACIQTIAPEAVIIPLRCFDRNGKSDSANLIKAINDAVNKYDCDIIQMSWGMKTDNAGLREVIGRAWQAGCVMVASSGNRSSSVANGTVFYPAAYEEVIGVGSVDTKLQVSDFSVQSSAVSMCSFGDGLIRRSASGSSYYSMRGTSFAAPLVSGAAALLLEARPELDNTETVSALISACVDLGETGYDEVYGYGVLDMDQLFSEEIELRAEISGSYLKVSGLLRENELLAAYTAEGRLCGIYSGGAKAALTSQKTQFCSLSFYRAEQVKLYRLDDQYICMTETETIQLRN